MLGALPEAMIKKSGRRGTTSKPLPVWLRRLGS